MEGKNIFVGSSDSHFSELHREQENFWNDSGNTAD